MASIEDYEGTDGHRLYVTRRQTGMTSIRPSRPLYGTTGRCSCMWQFKSNEAPSKGGRRHVVLAHREHVAEVTGKDESCSV